MAEFEFALTGGGRDGLIETLADLDSNAEKLRAGVAFVTTAGLESFDSVAPTSESTIEKWAVSIDQGITQPEALEQLVARPQTEVRVVNGAEALQNRSLITSAQFHPKLLWFDHGTTYDLCLGSSNFTQRGLHTNWEANIVLRNMSVADNRDQFITLSEWWDAAWEDATAVTPEFIDQYADIREEYIDRTPPSYLKRLTETETGLSEATILWSEVETVMGYTNHQFEVPIQCLQFFAREEMTVSVGDQVYVTFEHNGESFADRSIRAHQNHMCRVNLPNELGDRYDFTDYTVVFEYLSDEQFKVDLVPDDESAQQLEPLREESRRHDQILTMTRANREYGWL